MTTFSPKNKHLSISIIIIMILSISSMQLLAQTDANEKKWNYLTEVYIMFPYMDGEAGLGESLVLPVDASAGDIFEKLKMASMLYFEAHNHKWAINTDLVYMNLNQDLTPGKKIHTGTLGVKQMVWEVAGLYRINSFLEMGLGGRLNYLQLESEGRINVFPAGTEEFSKSNNKTWYDPIIIARFATDIKNKWLFQLRGDVGGFGLGSDLTWQLQGYAGYRFSKMFQLTAGYRVLSIDYKSGEESKEFIFNMKEFGPVIKLGFNF